MARRNQAGFSMRRIRDSEMCRNEGGVRVPLLLEYAWQHHHESTVAITAMKKSQI